MEKTFIVSWDCYGLESVLDVDALAGLETWDILKSTDPSWRLPRKSSLNQIVQAVILRAQVNGQRNYEVYMFCVDADMSEDDVRTMFDNAPQYSADLIRKRGTKLYCNRVTDSERRVIT